MKSLTIPQLGRKVSRLGIGTGGAGFRNGQKNVFDVFDAFVSAGGNLIDSSENYGDAEGIIGEWLSRSGKREDVIILDKGCHHLQLPGGHVFSVPNIEKAIEGSLKRLNTDYIDIWAFHTDNPEVPVEPIIDELNRQVAKGNLRAFGGSNWSVARIRTANEYAKRNGLMRMAVSSPHYSLAVPAVNKAVFWAGCTYATEEDMAWYAKVGMPVVAWSAQARGFFLESSGPDDTNQELVSTYHNEANFERLARARKLAKERGVTAIQIALAYVLHAAAPTIALVGPENTEQLASCVRAAEISLTKDEVNWLALRIPKFLALPPITYPGQIS